MDLKAVIQEFADRIQGLLEAQSMEKAKAEILGAFGIGAPRKPGRPPKTAVAVAPVATVVATKVRRKMPPQYCPVPGCKNKAAPIFGMVCAKHKDLPKAKIKKYREERRAKKEGVKVVAKKVPARRATRVIKKAPNPAKKAPKRTNRKASKPIAKKTPKRTTALKPTARKTPKRTNKKAAKNRPSEEVTSPVPAPTPSVAPTA